MAQERAGAGSGAGPGGRVYPTIPGGAGGRDTKTRLFLSMLEYCIFSVLPQGFGQLRVS